MQRYIRVTAPNCDKYEVNTLSKISQGFIVNHRRGGRTGVQKPHEYILRFPGIESVGEAGRLLGRKIAWPVGKREVRGKIVAVHGKNGFVRARFRKGVPGQALGSLVEIIG
jgi:large subunit ribosomal protein L35Ae